MRVFSDAEDRQYLIPSPRLQWESRVIRCIQDETAFRAKRDTTFIVRRSAPNGTFAAVYLGVIDRILHAQLTIKKL